jgi:hypothetical protein
VSRLNDQPWKEQPSERLLHVTTFNSFADFHDRRIELAPNASLTLNEPFILTLTPSYQYRLH